MGKEIGTGGQLQNRVSQELQPLVMNDLLMTGLVGVGGMGQCLMEQAQIGKGDSKSPRQF